MSGSLTGILDALLEEGGLADAVEAAKNRTTELALTGPAVAAPYAIAALAAAQSRNGAGKAVLAVTATGREADDLAAALGDLLPADEVVSYPAWETLPHERLSPRADTIGRRLAVLRRLKHPSADDATTGPIKVVCAPIRSVLQPQPAGLADLVPVQLHQGDDADLDDIVEKLADIAYARVELVGKRGEFAVRGGILDVFPPTEEHPIRVEFWGDEIEEIRYFAVADQRSLEVATHGGCGRRRAVSCC